MFKYGLRDGSFAKTRCLSFEGGKHLRCDECNSWDEREVVASARGGILVQEKQKFLPVKASF